MIVNAKDTKLNASYSKLPNLSNPIKKWVLPLSFIKITKTIYDGEVAETETVYNFEGVFQNLNSKQLQIKPEAERAWSWKMIHSLTNLFLEVDDKISFENKEYRVMNIINYKEYGYYEYHIVEDYNG